MPIVPAGESDFARALLRRGAQDYLIRFDFDHISMARALENAIERHRFLFAAENSALFDTSDLLNRRGLLFFAARLGWNPAYLTVCALRTPASDPDTRDALLLEAAEKIRTAAGDGALAARCANDRFAFLSRTLPYVAPEFRTISVPVTDEGAETALDTAEKQMSCENGLA